jgi:small subunit ribosomal protein S2
MAKAAKTVEEKAPKKVIKKDVKELENSKTQELKTEKVKSVSKKTVATEKAVAKTPKIKKSSAKGGLSTEKEAVVAEKAEIATSQAPRNDESVVAEVATEVVKAPRVAGSKVTVEELFEAGAHYGHVVKKWNPKMKGYLWGSMNGIHIFDLEQTVKGLEEACKTLSTLASTGKRIVIVGTKRQAKQMVEDEARRLGVPFITQRWMGGLITNWKQVKLTIDRLNKLKKDKEEGNLKKYTKKEQILFDKEISRLERIVGGISTLKEAPEVVVVIDTHKEKLVVKESHSKGVIVIGLVDSNANPDNVDYVIPMNDDSAKGLEIVIGELGRALETGLKNLKSK